MNNLDKFNQYTVQEGDSLYKIASEYEIDMKTLRAVNGLEIDDYIYPNQKLLVPKSNYGIYIVNDSETLKNIAKKLSVSEMNIVDNNTTLYLIPEQLLFFKKGKIS